MFTLHLLQQDGSSELLLLLKGMVINMKKICSFILCLIFLTQLLAPGTVSAETAAENEAYSINIDEEVYVLTRLGIIELSESYDPNVPVTRAEFANYTANAVSAVSDGKSTYFSDVPVNYWASAEINALVDSGIIDRAADGKFNPDRNISYAEACKMIAAATGYKAYADMNKVMNEYVNIARRAGFGINVKNQDEITLAEALKLLYNGMKTDILWVSSMSDKNYKTEVREGQTLFSIYHKVKQGSGRVESVFGKTLGGSDAESGYLYIDNMKYREDKGFSLDGFFARTVDFMYIDENDTKTVIYAKPHYKNDTLEIVSKDIIGYNPSERAIEFSSDESGNKVEKRTIRNNAEFIYNGQPCTESVKSKLEELIKGSVKGAVTLISNTGTRAYDTVCIEAFEIYAKDAYNTFEQKFFNAKNSKEVILNNYKYVRVKDVKNTEYEIEAIPSGPYMIAAADNGQSISVIICNMAKSGILEKTSASDRKITVGGQEYVVDKAYFGEISDTLKPGGEYKLTFDLYGEVIDITTVAVGGMKIGYITEAAMNNSGFEKKLKFKIYCEDDTLKIYELADKVRIDEITYNAEDCKKILVAIPGSVSLDGDSLSVERQIIRFATNEEGLINKIDTRNVSEFEDRDNSLVQVHNGSEKLTYCTGPRRLGMDTYIDSTVTKFMAVPITDDKGEIYVNGSRVDDTIRLYANKYGLQDWSSYYAEVYKFSPNTIAADLIVIRNEPKEESYDTIMYKDTIMGLTSDEEVVKKLRGYSMGGLNEYVLDDIAAAGLADIEEGDIISVETDSRGETIYSITKMFDISTLQFEPYQTWTDPNRYWYAGTYADNSSGVWRSQNYQITKAYAYDIKNKIIASSYELSKAHDGEISEVTDGSQPTYIIYDRSLERNRISTGQISDLLSFKTAGENCDLILTCSSQSKINQIFVIKR